MQGQEGGQRMPGNEGTNKKGATKENRMKPEEKEKKEGRNSGCKLDRNVSPKERSRRRRRQEGWGRVR